MGRHFIRVIFLVALLGLAPALRAQAVITIKFDEIPTGSLPAELYAGFGLHFGAGPVGVQAGIANGDPGNWGLDGTNGPYFLGFNGSPAYGETVTFDAAVFAVALDVSGSNGSSPTDTFTLTAFSGATPIATQTVTLATINAWQTVAVSSVATPSITSVQFFSSGGAFRPFGVDNLQVTAVPEPSTAMLTMVGAAGVLLAARRRRFRI